MLIPKLRLAYAALWVALLLLGCSDRGSAGTANRSLQLPSTEARERARRIAVLQADSGSEYRARELDPGVWSASNPRLQLGSRFETGRVSLLAARASISPGTPVELAAVAWGCENALQAVPATPPAPSTQRPGAIEYHHRDFDEWYLPGPAGVEQGFTIRALPACAEQGQALQIQLALGEGAVSASAGNAGEAVLSAPGARPVHYGAAFAEDAMGREASVRIRTNPGLMLELDVRDAQLPILVDPLAWVERQKLAATDGSAGDFFGKALAVSGDTLLVGAYGDDDHGIDSGSAYVFVRAAGAWTLQQKLTASDGAAGDSFGYAVALSGDTAVVGAYLADGAAADSGAAYVFARSGSGWTQQAKLVASDAAASDHLAASVAISGKVVLLGAPLKKSESASEVGAAYTFAQNGALWAEQAKLVPSNTAGDHNGTGVAISGSNLALGTARANGYTVSFYAFGANGWTAAGSANSSNSNFAYYGSALAMSAAYTVIGNYAHPLGPSAFTGSVLVVSNAVHTQQYTLRANDGSVNDLFGRAVAISDRNLILVGSPQDDDQGDDSGSAYGFTFAGSAWTLQQKLLPSDGKANDGFGSAVAVSTSAALVGAWQGKVASGAGAVYAEALAQTGAPCTQDKQCDSGFCVESVCCASACSGACQSCLQKNKAANGGVDGVCGSVAANTDPRDDCPEGAAGSCGPTGLCDGKGACLVRSAGVSCTFSACAGPTSSTLNSACDGNGECKPTATVACQVGYACVTGICRSGCHADSDCDGSLGFICTKAGVCKEPKGAVCTSDVNCSTGTCQYGHCCLADADDACIKPLGIQCTLASECASGQCTDGVCCSSSSCGFCQSCAIPGSAGSCGPLATAPPDTPGHAVCAGGGQGGAPGDSNGGAANAGRDTGGSAGVARGELAGNTGSAGNAGRTTQSGDAGVHQGGSSGRNASAPVGAPTGNSSGNGAISQAGATGTPGAIASECSTDADCSDGLACDPRSHTCQDLLVKACGCRVAGERSASDSWLAAFALALLAGAQRRKRRAQPSAV
ncbi:MAG: FG-GAP repeat protein [Pseudomonadota bacterium]